MINEIKFIKAAYGFENHHRCAFNARGLSSFKRILNYMETSELGKSSPLWIAIYIPKSAMGWRAKKGLRDIRSFSGQIAAFQEILYSPEMNYGYDEQWPMGVKAGRIFKFKKPCLELQSIFDSDKFSSFIGFARNSAAMELDASDEKIILEKIHEIGLEEEPYSELI